MKHSKYPWDEFAAVGITKVHCLAFSTPACETTVIDQLHPNKQPKRLYFYYHFN